MAKSKFIKLIGKFIGPRKIVGVAIAKRKTYLGKDVAEVEFDDKLVKEYPEEMLDAIATQEKKDLAVLRDLAVEPIVKKILIFLVESELTLEDIKYLMATKVPLSMEESIKMAYKNLWGKESYEVTLLDVDQALQNGKTGPKKEN